MRRWEEELVHQDHPGGMRRCGSTVAVLRAQLGQHLPRSGVWGWIWDQESLPPCLQPSKQKRKFSSFFKSLVIELDKELYGPDNHLVEVRWEGIPVGNGGTAPLLPLWMLGSQARACPAGRGA